MLLYSLWKGLGWLILYFNIPWFLMHILSRVALCTAIDTGCLS